MSNLQTNPANKAALLPLADFFQFQPSGLKLELSLSEISLGFATHPRADVMYRDHIDPWLGRGPCAVVNNIGIAE